MDIQPEQARTLAAIVAHGSFDAVATHLSVTASAVSQRVRALEVAVGRPVLRRTRPIELTSSGQAVVRFARQLDMLSADLAEELQPGGAPSGVRLTLVINSDSLHTWALPGLAAVAGTVQLEILREDQDYSLDLLRQPVLRPRPSPPRPNRRPVARPAGWASCGTCRSAAPASLRLAGRRRERGFAGPRPRSSSSTARTSCRTATCGRSSTHSAAAAAALCSGGPGVRPKPCRSGNGLGAASEIEVSEEAEAAHAGFAGHRRARRRARCAWRQWRHRIGGPRRGRSGDPGRRPPPPLSRGPRPRPRWQELD